MKKLLLFISVILLIDTFVYTGLPLQALAMKGNNNKVVADAVKEKASEWMNNNSFHFLENKGQMTDMAGNPVPFVLFKAEAPGMNMYITEKGLTNVFIKPEEEKEKEKEGFKEENMKIEWNRIDMSLKDASIKKENILKEGESADFSQYFLAHCPDGVTNVRSYQKITITNVYPGIDWIFYNSNEKGFKYGFIVHPGASSHHIELVYSSLNPLQLNKVMAFNF